MFFEGPETFRITDMTRSLSRFGLQMGEKKEKNVLCISFTLLLENVES